MLEAARLADAEALLVHTAAGGVGTAVARAARRSGARLIIGTVGSQTRLEQAKAAGYDHVLVRDANLASAVLKRTRGRGADAILDPQGSAWVEADLDAAAPGGRVVVFGNASGAPLAPLPAPGVLMARNLSVTGFSLAALARTQPQRLGNALARVLADLAAGRSCIDVAVADGLEGASACHEALADGAGNVKPDVRIR